MTAQILEYDAGDGAGLSYRLWPSEPGADALVYLHGIESHSEWFSACAGEIAGAGVSVYAPDRRGSGLNRAERGHCRVFLQFVDDIIRFARSIEDSHSRLHTVALSWGGKLAVAADMLHPGTFSTMTLIAPGIFPRVMPGMGARIAIAVDALLRPGAFHPIPIRNEMFTKVPKHLEYIASDPLRLRSVTARFYLESVKLDRFLRKRKYQWTVPTQLLLAEHDEIVDNRRLRDMFESLTMEIKKIAIYEGCKHSLQFERPAEVARDIVSWIGSASGR